MIYKTEEAKMFTEEEMDALRQKAQELLASLSEEEIAELLSLLSQKR